MRCVDSVLAQLFGLFATERAAPWLARGVVRRDAIELPHPLFCLRFRFWVRYKTLDVRHWTLENKARS